MEQPKSAPEIDQASVKSFAKIFKVMLATANGSVRETITTLLGERDPSAAPEALAAVAGIASSGLLKADEVHALILTKLKDQYQRAVAVGKSYIRSGIEKDQCVIFMESVKNDFPELLIDAAATLPDKPEEKLKRLLPRLLLSKQLRDMLANRIDEFSK